jgi:hypothetical protein
MLYFSNIIPLDAIYILYRSKSLGHHEGASCLKVIQISFMLLVKKLKQSHYRPGHELRVLEG